MFTMTMSSIKERIVNSSNIKIKFVKFIKKYILILVIIINNLMIKI